MDSKSLAQWQAQTMTFESSPEINSIANGVVNLLLTAPHLRDALKRPVPCEESRHQLYDMEVAEHALRHGWTSEEIARLLQDTYQANRIMPIPAKGYFLLVCNEADIRNQAGAPDGDTLQDFARETSSDRLSEYWQIPIARVIRHGDENATWNLVLTDGREILLGTSKQIQKQDHVRAVIFDRIGVMIPRIAQKQIHEWDRLLEMLFAMATTVESTELSRIGQARELLTLYLGQQPGGFAQDFDEDEWEALALRNRPFRRDDAIYVHARGWWNSCVRPLAPEITYAESIGMLRLIGAKSQRVTLHKVAHTDRSYWKLPQSFLEEKPNVA